MIEDANCHDYVIRRDGRIVASICLCVAHSTEQTIGFLESLVISSAVRGQGLGRELMQHVIAQAPLLGIGSLHFTSKPARVAANALYRSLGFQQRETNVYVMSF